MADAGEHWSDQVDLGEFELRFEPFKSEKVSAALHVLKTDHGTAKDFNRSMTSWASTVGSSLTAFDRGNKYEKWQAGLNIVGATSQFLTLTGPEGALAAAAITSVCSIVSGVIGLFNKKKKEPSLAEQMQKVVEQALKVQTDDELKSLAAGEMASLQLRLSMVNLISQKKAEDIDETSRKGLVESDFLMQGNQFLHRLIYYVRKYRVSKEKSDATRAVQLLYCFCEIACMRAQMLCLYSTLCLEIGAKAWSELANEALRTHEKMVASSLSSVGTSPIILKRSFGLFRVNISAHDVWIIQ